MPPVDPSEDVGDVAALFAAVAGIGPFFAVRTGAVTVGPGWVPLCALAGEPTGDDPLTTRIAAVRAALGTDARVAASTAFLGLAAQLVAPLYATAVVAGAVPAHEGGRARALHWRPGDPGLWWVGGGHVVPCPDAATLRDVLVALLAPLVTAVRARVSVAERVLWGDVASAVASARQLVVAARPPAAARASDLAGGLLTRPPLAATAALRAPEPPDRGWTFRRRSCCLYYRVPGGGLCGDCVLHDRRASRGG
jgi:FhuF 2Fe-2S C-terminal domain